MSALDPYRSGYRPLRVCVGCFSTVGELDRCPRCGGPRRELDDDAIDDVLRERAHAEVLARAHTSDRLSHVFFGPLLALVRLYRRGRAIAKQPIPASFDPSTSPLADVAAFLLTRTE